MYIIDFRRHRQGWVMGMLEISLLYKPGPRSPRHSSPMNLGTTEKKQG